MSAHVFGQVGTLAEARVATGEVAFKGLISCVGALVRGQVATFFK